MLSFAGAHFLEVTVKKFDEFHKSIDAHRDKCCYNSVLVIAYLYNYLVSHLVTIYRRLTFFRSQNIFVYKSNTKINLLKYFYVK